jgi:hypothetical protein
MNTSISGSSVYYNAKSHKFGHNKAACQAFMTALCRKHSAQFDALDIDHGNDTTDLEGFSHEDINEPSFEPIVEGPTPREQLDILSAENNALRAELKMVKQLNAKMSAPKDFSSLASALREGLVMMDARKGSRTHKDGVVAINSIACILSNNS